MRPILLSLLALLGAACIIPSSANAQDIGNGYAYRLNGRDYEAVDGYQTYQMDTRTGELVRPRDGVPTAESIMTLHIARFCGIDPRNGTGYQQMSQCVGGFLAVGRQCNLNPERCQFFRIISPYDQEGEREVRLSRIAQQGRDLWIARPNDRLWETFGRCFNSQFTAYQRVNRCY